MREITDNTLKAQLSVDDGDRVRQINHINEPWESSQESPLMAAIDYLHQMSGVLKVSSSELQNPHQKVSFVEPIEQGEEYRLGDQKQLFDSTTIIFNQTYLNVPVWRAGITLTLKHNPNRVLMVADTSQQGIEASLPSQEKIEEHRRVFALAAADQRLRALGLGDQARAAGLAESDDQPRTATFIRRVLGRDMAMAEDAPSDDARAIRGRFFVYRYNESQRLPRLPNQSETPEETPASGVEPSAPAPPILTLPPVDPLITEGAWRLVSEVTFSLTTPQYGALNWRALVDVETDSVLFLEPLVAGQNGMVFQRDPITSTGNVANAPNQNNGVLNPLRTPIQLPNLSAPVGGVQSLRGRFAVLVNVDPPNIAAPTEPAGTPFDYDVRTNDFAAVNTYYHTDRFFTLVESLGFPINVYFNNTTFPLTVDHRCGDTINAHCGGNGVGGIGHAGYALNDLTNITNPIGRACDSRVHLHELGGHGTLFEHVGSGVFGFAHSAGDSLSALLHDPDTLAPDRFRYAPWNPVNARRFDLDVANGWAWGGPPAMDDREYGSEQILCTTLFRVYQSIGGDSTDLGQRRFASRLMMYLILRAISTLTPATNPSNAIGFANALMAVDLLNWTSEGVFGGAYNKVIRWSFEKQGLYQAPGAPVPVTRAGEPPAVDVYIDDGRSGEYPYQPVYWNNPSVWNRRAADGGEAHQEPLVGATNYVYVRIKNRGTQIAQNVRVRGFHHKAAATTVWPDDFAPLATTELAAGTLAARNSQEKIVGPFAWIPSADALGQDSLLMVASADGDASNVDHVTVGEAIPEWRLVPNDNNLGLRRVVPAPTETDRPVYTMSDGADAGEMKPASSAEQFLQTLGLSGQLPKNVRIKNLTLQLEFEEDSSPPSNAVSRLPATPTLIAAEADNAAEWGIRRHAAIATAAMDRLQSQNARDQILRILDESGESSLGEAAMWADKLKWSDPPSDPATDRFLAANRGYSSWHYVNLPLYLDGYDREQHPEFTRRDDVVQIILLCVESLRNPGPRARFEEITALRWLTHLVGDLHQPVHVGCGFIANAQTNQAYLVFDPDEAIGLSSDRGGGMLLLQTGDNLHSFWDSLLGPDLVPDALNAESDAALIRVLASTPAPAAASVDIPSLVISWANASLVAARNAYQSLRITRFIPSNTGDVYEVDWEGEQAYRQRCAPIVSARMAAAAANLASLLDTIWP